MTQGVKDLINAIVEGDASSIDAAFNSEMANRISSKLDDMRSAIAQNMFKTEQAQAEEEEVIEEEVDFEELNEEEVVDILESLTDEEINEELSDEDAISLEEKYMGFSNLKSKLAGKPGVKNPAALAAAIGRKKYGKEKFQRMAAAGKTHKESWKEEAEQNNE